MLIRLEWHGESEGNFAGSLQGSRFDTPLGPRAAPGRGARGPARERGPRRRVGEPAGCGRARRRPRRGPHGLPLSIDADLMEFDWGVWSGRPFDGVLDQEVSAVRARWRAGETDLAPSGGESPAMAATRVERFPRPPEAADPHAPLVVAHGRFNRILMALLLGRPLSRMDEIRQRNGSSVFGMGRDRAGADPSRRRQPHPRHDPDRLDPVGQRQVDPVKKENS
ncbi:MAG: histidine phosphatase family protein [Acidobacteria bacterium]|nr:histidine phosphatase family protein [Acidobacteriota bacterium]